jgi:putative spermidine/putrescine transport system permease protein
MNNSIQAGWFARTVTVVATLFLLGPLVIIVGMSLGTKRGLQFPPDGITLRWYGDFLASPMWQDAIQYSLRLGLIVAAIATVTGTALAVGLSRCSPRLRSAGFGIAMLPLIVPGIAVAVAMYLTFSSWRIVATTPALVLAHVALAIPFVMVNVMSSLQLIDRDFERAAVSLGAHPLVAFWHTTLRLAMPGVLAGAVFAFIVSWDEVVLAIFLSGPTTKTLPMLMWEQMRSEIEPTIAAVGSCLMIMTVLGLAAGAAGRMWTRRRVMEASRG